MTKRKRDWRTHRPRRPGAGTWEDWQRVSRAVYERDSWRCVLPDCTRGLGPLQAHHVVARSAGGADEPGNLVSLHPTCHERVQREWRKWVPAFQAYLRGVARDAS